MGYQWSPESEGFGEDYELILPPDDEESDEDPEDVDDWLFRGMLEEKLD